MNVILLALAFFVQQDEKAGGKILATIFNGKVVYGELR